MDEVANNGHDSAEVTYVQTMTRWLHEHDPTRMVAVDVWGDHPPAHPGSLYRGVDAIAETDYSGWYDHPHNSPAAVSAEISRRLRAMQRTFAGRVLVISEFGAESNGLNRPAARAATATSRSCSSATSGCTRRTASSAACSSTCCATTR